MNPEIKTKWVAALRSGKYIQGQSRLRNHRDQFCCLGVLCDIYDPTLWNGTIFCEFTSTVPRKIAQEIGLERKDETELISQNDSLGQNFNEIADYIEQNL